MKSIEQLQAQLEAGVPFTYDDAADLYTQTAVGQASLKLAGLDRAGLLAHMRQRYPVEAQLADVVAQLFLLAGPAAPGRH